MRSVLQSLIGVAMLLIVSPSAAQTISVADRIAVAQAAQAICKGNDIVDVVAADGKIIIDNLSVKVNDAKTKVTISKPDGDIGSIELGTYNDFTACVKQTTEMLLPELATKKSEIKIPPDLFNIVEIGEIGRTSIKYLSSILGVPKSEDERHAEFVVNGYYVVAFFLDKDSANGNKGTIIKLDVTVIDSSLAKQTPVILNGRWNPGNCTDVAVEGCVPEITPLSLGEQDKLKNYLKDSDCYPELEGYLNNADSEYFCLLHELGVSLFIQRRFELDISSLDDFYRVLRLRDYIREPDVAPLDSDVVKEWEKEIGIAQLSNDKKIERLEAIAVGRLKESPVKGFSISVGSFDDYYEE
ncbi:hypothetical protein [Rhizobium leguminosarum]|uniref:hypothetical protein n=1 Tax=Rhizobium leguminosarum TaxID=384 RepID=UPI001F41BBCD|nr:hypothetical protein [Rhizobium leguminosarum]UIJ79125.1 hypothetical protein LZK78_20535 [Rhizobium leguminosarum]